MACAITMAHCAGLAVLPGKALKYSQANTPPKFLYCFVNACTVLATVGMDTNAL